MRIYDKNVSEILKDAKKIATYTRVSSNEQKFERQIEIISHLVDDKKIHDPILFDEKESATKKEFTKREKLSELLQSITEGNIDALVVSDVDRLARNPKEHAELRKFFNSHNVPVILASRNQLYTSDDIVRNALEDGLSKLEVDNLSTRLRASLNELMRNGSFRGGKTPYGFRLVKDGEKRTLVQEPDEIEIVKEIFSWYQTSENFNSIARKLNELNIGYISKEKRCSEKKIKWTPNKVKYIITNPIYTGKYVYHRFVNEHGYELKPREEWKEANDSWLVSNPPISSEVWEICWRKYEKLSQNSPKYSTTPFYFKGILKCKCEKCNGADFNTKDRRKNGKGYRLYISQCNKKLKANIIHDFFHRYWEKLCNKSFVNFQEDVKNILELELVKVKNELSSITLMYTEQKKLLDTIMQQLYEKVKNDQFSEGEFIDSYDSLTIGLMITEEAVNKKIELLEQNLKKYSYEKGILEKIIAKPLLETDIFTNLFPKNGFETLSDAKKRALALMTVKECYVTINEHLEEQFCFVLNSPFKQYFDI
ncbi:recombinase family protein [Bacillus sp. RG28]|uniref:Recombinase family protein n=1 Tax=Gottfriedia endophytica TaxID=2820819 RepID=A0A940NEC8_9BACI|nr:recombinase family protein [Gottfriedia endophytica]MBP0723939.1 recombinase family protein [Gottfriedia endophytica]